MAEITSLGLTHTASNERISSGVPRLDEMLGGEGFYRGGSVLVSGTAMGMPAEINGKPVLVVSIGMSFL